MLWNNSTLKAQVISTLERKECWGQLSLVTLEAFLPEAYLPYQTYWGAPSKPCCLILPLVTHHNPLGKTANGYSLESMVGQLRTADETGRLYIVWHQVSSRSLWHKGLKLKKPSPYAFSKLDSPRFPSGTEFKSPFKDKLVRVKQELSIIVFFSWCSWVNSSWSWSSCRQ